MRTPTFLLGLWLLSAGICHAQLLAESTQPKPDESQRVPVGQLGYPLGSYLVIEGIGATSGLGFYQMLIVDTVSGHKLPSPIQVDLSTKFPAGVRCVFRGYETGAWGGYPPLEVESSGDRNKYPETQSFFGFHNRFVITSVVQPADFKLPTSYGP